jgi:hypothetical protein
MDTRTLPAASSEDVSGWERALYAFLAEKERRSGSRRTVEGYARMLRHFVGMAGSARARHRDAQRWHRS